MKQTLFLLVGLMLVTGAALAATDGTSTTPSYCMAAAACEDGSLVSCTGTASCLATDDSCPVERGHVVCDGVTTWCPRCTCPVEGEVCYDGNDCRPDGVRPCASCLCAAQYPDPGFCICPK